MPSGTKRQEGSLGEEPQKAEQVREQQSRLQTLRVKTHRVETLKKAVSETKRQPEVRDFFLYCFKCAVNCPSVHPARI